MPEQSTIRRAAAIVAGARPLLSETTAAHASAVKEYYGLGRRVLALLLGIQLPIPFYVDPTPAAPIGPLSLELDSQARPVEIVADSTAPSPEQLDATPDDERDDYGSLLHVLKEYVVAAPAERLRLRPHALEYLKDLNGLLKITAVGSRFRRSLTIFDSPGQRSTAYHRHQVKVDFPGLDEHQQFMYSIHRDAVHEVRDRLDSFRWRRQRPPMYHLRFRRDRSTDSDALQVLIGLRNSTADPDQLFIAWRQKIPVEPDYVAPHEQDLSQMIDRMESGSGEPITQKLEDVRDALAVASHYFIGDDLSGADLTDVPLRGVHWSPATTTWPVLWHTTIANASVPVEPGILRVDDDVTIRG